MALRQNDISECELVEGTSTKGEIPAYRAPRLKLVLNWIRENVNLFAAFLIGVGIATVLIAPVFSVLLEDAQTIAFPLLLIGVIWLLPLMGLRQRVLLSIPACLLWVFASSYIRGYTPDLTIARAVYVAQLGPSDDGFLFRTFDVHYNILAAQLSLPTMKLLRRSFDSDKEADRWLEVHSEVPLLLSGSLPWLRAFVPVDLRSRFLWGEKQRRVAPLVKQTAEALGVELGLRTASINVIPELNLSLALSLGPQVFSLPVEEQAIAQYYTAWLSGGLDDDVASLPLDASVELVSKRRAKQLRYFQEAAAFEGPWQSGAPLGAAHFFIGTLQMIHGLADGFRGDAVVQCAVSALTEAAKFTPKWQEAELFSLIFNNAAVARIATASTDKDFAQARHWLWHATTAVTEKGAPTSGAKLALVNLTILERAGVF